MLTKSQILIFEKSAQTLYSAQDYTSATILYFKTWFAIQDYVLLDKIGESPKDHTSRFRLLEKHFPELYSQLDIEFGTYRDTYSKIIDKETCERIRKIVLQNVVKYHINQ